MGLIDRLRTTFAPVPVERGWNDGTFSFNGVQYPYSIQQTLLGSDERIPTTFDGYAASAYGGNGIVFAVLNARLNLFKQARFMWRSLRSGVPGELWSSPALDILRVPWLNGTTSDLLGRMEQDASLAGNSLYLRRPGRLVRLRPDWTTIIHGSPNDPEASMWDPDAVLLGYAYQPGGPAASERTRFFQPSEVAHYAPIPDPLAPARGMSWISPLLREIEADTSMTSHKLTFLRNGATPNLVVTGVPGATPEAFKEWVDKFAKGHDGSRNAGKTMYLTAAVDAKVIGSNLAELDYRATQGAGETRIAAAGNVPAVVVGISEGLAGSSLNAGNFAASMRRFADMFARPAWADACGSLASIVPVPGAGENELWYDERFVPALKDDILDAAEVQAKQAQAIRQYVDAGFEPSTVVDAINAGDLKRLKHTGLFSVQLQPPQPDGPPKPEPGDIPSALAPFVKPAAAEPVAPAPKREDDYVFEALTIVRAMAEREQPAPVNNITVNTPDVRNEITVQPTPPTPVEIRNELTVEPTPIEITNEVSVEPTPITVEAGDVTVNMPEQRGTIKTIVREAGQITRIIEEPTDG